MRKLYSFSVQKTENSGLCDVFTDGNLLFFNGKYKCSLEKIVLGKKKLNEFYGFKYKI